MTLAIPGFTYACSKHVARIDDDLCAIRINWTHYDVHLSGQLSPVIKDKVVDIIAFEVDDFPVQVRSLVDPVTPVDVLRRVVVTEGQRHQARVLLEVVYPKETAGCVLDKRIPGLIEWAINDLTVAICTCIRDGRCVTDRHATRGQNSEEGAG